MIVPDCPASTTWVDVLHWCLRVMDADDSSLGFVASLLAHAHKHGGLTEKQERHAERIVLRVSDDIKARRSEMTQLQGAPAGVTIQ